jgi:predicted TIM-barrel fold metal-dependent hydrolase
MQIIDVFTHIFPPRSFQKFLDVAPALQDMGRRTRNVPLLLDLEARFRVMDEFDDYAQVISLASPPIESYASAEVAPLVARIANDEMAEIASRYHDRFPAFAASVALNNPAAAVEELYRAVRELGARAVQIYTNVAGKPLDAAEFDPFFDAVVALDVPILLHPARGASLTDYTSEAKSKYEIWWTFGWPYETSTAMARLVFSGMFDRRPDIKIITHHMGGIVPYVAGRVGYGWDQLGTRTSDEDYVALLRSMKKRPVDYFHMFYGDTAMFGNLAGTRCGLDFFGADRVLFASDFPFEPKPGTYIRDTIAVMQGLALPPTDEAKICRENAVRMLRLG